MTLKPLGESHRKTSRQQLHRQRRRAGRAPIPYRRPQRPTGDDVCLPMRLAFQAGEGVVQREYLERPNPRVLPSVICDEWGHEARLEGDLAAGETLMAAPLEPLIGIVALRRAGPAESIFEHRRADSRDCR